MKKGVIKRVISFALAGTLVVGAQMILPPVQVEAAWAWNEMTSESGYPKVPTDQISVVADSEETGAIGQDGPAVHAVDGNVNSYWHTNWHNVNPVTGTPEAIEGNNTITLTLEEPVDLAGITYLPRQQVAANNNGPIEVCRVYVSYDGSAFDDPPVAESDWTYPRENWNESIAEKELLFSDSVAGVKAVKIVVDEAMSNEEGVPFINAAEIGLLMPKGAEAERNLVAKETEYWNEQVTAGTMAAQGEDDEWLYQVKRESTGQWENIGSEYFYPNYTPGTETFGNGSWMQSSDGQNDNFHYSKLTASQITCTFGSTDYSEVAYAWRVQEKGYYRATLVNPIGASNGIPLIVRHSSSEAWNVDGEVMLPETVYNAGQIFESRIVEAEAGDIIRIGASGENVWATGFEPAIEKVTAKEYVEQWLADNADILGRYENGLYTEETVQAVTEAIEGLDTALLGEDESAIEAALEALQEKLSALQEKEFNKNIQTEYWEYSKLSGTLPVQDDSDIWYYQVKENGSWENVADSYFDADAFDGDGVWMSDGNTMPNPYHYAAIGKTKLTPCFNNDTYGGVAFAWKASESGYARVRFAEEVSLGSGKKAPVTLTISKGASTNDSETLLTKEIALGETYQADEFTTKYVYVSAGDYLRISAASANNDVLGVTPIIETMTVREYATQYLEEMQGIDISDKPAVSAGEFSEARTDLDGLLKKEPAATDEEIKAAVDKLELAEANLDKYTVTYIRTAPNGVEQTDELKQGYEDKVTINTIIPEGKKFDGWRLGGADGVIVSQETSYTFLVAGDMTVTASFSEAGTVMQPAVSISNVHIEERADNGKYNVRFNGQVTKPEGYGLYEAGLLWSINEIDTDSLTSETDPSSVENTRKVNVDSVSSSYQYSVTITNVPSENTIYGVAFAKVYNRGTGQYEWVYSQMETAIVP